MKKEWCSIKVDIIKYEEMDIIRTSGDDYEGEIDWD